MLTHVANVSVRISSTSLLTLLQVVELGLKEKIGGLDPQPEGTMVTTLIRSFQLI